MIGTQLSKLVIFFCFRQLTVSQRPSSYRFYAFGLGMVAIWCDTEMRITLQASNASWDELTLNALIVGMVEILIRMAQASVIRWYYGRIHPNPRLMHMHMVEEYAEMAAEYIAISIAILYRV